MNGFYRSHIKRYAVFLLCFFGIIISFSKPSEKYFVSYGIFANKFNMDNSIYYGQLVKTTALTNKLYGYIQTPTFIENGCIYDQYMCIINNINGNVDFNTLIRIQGINCLFAMKSFYKLKEIENCHILSMILVDNRRWNVQLEFNGKVILLKCNEGIPNIKKLKEWNKKYDLFNICDVIDLRFNNLMVVG